ncbi:hypothetical protein K1719_034308 [Acacia pycnantha]|nr:hypothetical protein K1719_034308 [Acacia pycnantha]
MHLVSLIGPPSFLKNSTNEIHEFNKDSHKSKGNKRKTVGGCVYFLVPLNTSRPGLIGPMTGLRAEASEKKQKGLLARASRSHHDTTSASFDPHTMLTHPVTLVSMLGQEMMALQDRLTESPNNQPSSSGESEEEDEKERDEEDDEKEMDEEDDEKEI